MTGVGGWLDGRRPPMPGSLRRAVDAALEERPIGPDGGSGAVGPVAERLAAAGLFALGRVARTAPARSGAAELLAADALITYACEAAAEDGLESLDALLAELDLSRFGALLEGARS